MEPLWLSGITNSYDGISGDKLEVNQTLSRSNQSLKVDLENHLVSCLDNNFGYDLIQEYRVSQALCLLALEESLSIHVREGLVETSSCINSA